MATVKAVLLKPLDGFSEGSAREFDQADFDRLKDMGAVRAAGGKAATPPLNKMAVEPSNKNVTSARNKTDRG